MLLLVLETWVVTPRMGRSLGGFQDKVARILMGHLPRRKPDRNWTYTSEVAAREEVGFQTMEEYIWELHNTFVQYIAM